VPSSGAGQPWPALAHHNPIGTVHGGWIATLLDAWVGCAAHWTLAAGKVYTAAELKINGVRPVTTRVGLLGAIGQTIQIGRRMATAEGRLVGQAGKLDAHASTPSFIFEAPWGTGPAPAAVRCSLAARASASARQPTRPGCFTGQQPGQSPTQPR
jgi:uncharacterized protein (TIGR00369 family)